MEVNGRAVTKGALPVRPGDSVRCRVLPPPPLQAAPEDIPLSICYEDEHLLVVNKVRVVGGVGGIFRQHWPAGSATGPQNASSPVAGWLPA